MMYDLDGTSWWSGWYWERRCIMLVGMLILSVIPYTAWAKVVVIAVRVAKSLKRSKRIIRIVRRVLRGEGLDANSVVQGIFTLYFGWNDIKTACRKAW